MSRNKVQKRNVDLRNIVVSLYNSAFRSRGDGKQERSVKDCIRPAIYEVNHSFSCQRDATTSNSETHDDSVTVEQELRGQKKLSETNSNSPAAQCSSTGVADRGNICEVNQSCGMAGVRDAHPNITGRVPSAPRVIHPNSGTVVGQTIRFSAEKIIGNGSFGVVFRASVIETGEIVAIKKVLQDKRFKNRELNIMRQLAKYPHPNIIALKHCFYSSDNEIRKESRSQSRGKADAIESAREDTPNNVFLNLVLEYMPETVYSVARRWQKSKTLMPVSHVRMYMYQLCRALGQIHALGICHRDVKPQNLLLDPDTQLIKLIDFGSAKVLVPGEPNVSYICSRYYRAPELIFGSTEYTTGIDTWSSGCVFAELLLGAPLFPGESGVDQLVEIIKVLGTPSKADIRAMNASYTEVRFPQIRGHDWNRVFRSRTPPRAVECISRFLAYAPAGRILPLYAVAHNFFDEIRILNEEHEASLSFPPLFNFTKLELASFPGLSHLRPFQDYQVELGAEATGDSHERILPNFRSEDHGMDTST